jgi:hypothetical protein
MRRALLHTSRDTPARAGVIAAALLVSACSPFPSTPASFDPGPPAPVVEYVNWQEILTPLPLRVRLPARYGAEHVLVFVLTWGSRDWAVLELSRSGQTWSGEVSCRAVSTVTGDTRYFFLALDAQGEAVVGSGSPEWPHVATIVQNLPGGAQALRGEFTPARCHDPADCPPDFPGCPAYAVLRPACTTDAECSSGTPCEWDGYCGGAPVVEPEVEVEDAGDPEDRLAIAVRKATRRYRIAAASRPTRW